MKIYLMAEVSLFKSILTCKCPKCRKGRVFTHKNPYHRKFGKIEKKCSVCNFIYEMEQGFWYGAMYFSYAFGVLISIPVVVLLLFGGKKIPELMRGLGKGISEFKKGKKEIDKELKD